ncbi:hypothetical protein MLD38_028774 [Melastoma candidum]|uniref:Uncharacterized protein n=1 Tax=Melastoma candidum TaxID=119954 RepID=A0ACB9N239_9MYRT|nr:hypothetical protein MLD38_028774 [Melastoma candidum]
MVSLTLSLSTPPISRRVLPSTSSLTLGCDKVFFHGRRRTLARAASDESPTGSNQYIGGVPVAEVTPFFDGPSSGQTVVSEVVVEEQAPLAQEDLPPPPPPPPAQEDQLQPIEILQNIKDIESGDVIPIALYGSGALIALWLASAVVRAIDSIPLVPKLMELVGLAYSVWFGYRYLLYKSDREELFAKIEELKQEVLGFDNYFQWLRWGLDFELHLTHAIRPSRTSQVHWTTFLVAIVN